MLPAPPTGVLRRMDPPSDLDGPMPDPLELPPPWTLPARPAVPVLASVVPVVGAVGLWAVTGSVLALWLAALGPLIAGASLLDAARSARREGRRAVVRAHEARDRVARRVDERHADERKSRWAQHPDVAAFVSRESEVWRPHPARRDALVVGAGVRPSALRVVGGGDEPESAALRARAARLEHAPIVVSSTAVLAVVGAPVVADAVVRALVMQLCLAIPPGELRITGALRGPHEWADRLPHRRSSGGRTLALGVVGEPLEPADLTIVRSQPGEELPSGCGAVLTVESPDSALLDCAGERVELTVEALGAGQADVLAGDLAERAAGIPSMGGVAEEPAALAPLLAGAPAPSRGRLPAVIGVCGGDPFVVDLVLDGPHAVVAGVTGSGKSELLVTWILALCSAHTTAQVTLLLADFKGGTAFDSLIDLPHVTGVITDLEGAGARRAIESLRAEIRWREGVLARAGARDILDPRVDLPRLVVVVDEFAALLGEHPELHAVFTDVAARGRALGMHLILGTQRPAGVIRESLLANCPLRVSLRVTDPVDSRAIVGTDEAAALPGSPAARGLALVKTAADAAPRRVRIALSQSSDAATIAAAAVGPRPRRPWLPDLPARVRLTDLAPPGADESGVLVIGLADEPERQRQRPIGVRVADRGLLVVGAGGTGKSTALRTIAAQATGAVEWLPSSGEALWDAVSELHERPPSRGSLIMIDDLDALGGALPADYAREILERLDRLLRTSGGAGALVVCSAQRLTGAASRLGDLLPRRLVLTASSRAEHLAAGGDPAHFAPAAAPGRGRLDGVAVQVAEGPPPSTPRIRDPAPWYPSGPLSGFVMRRSPGARAALAEWESDGARIITLDEFGGPGEWFGTGPVVVAGDAEEWQRQWRALSSLRADHDLVVDAGCAAEVRVLTGERGLPPYCEPGRARGWLMRSGAGLERVVLPSGPHRTQR